MFKNNYIILTASRAKGLNRFNCPLEYRAKTRDANWWPLLAAPILDEPERFEYRGKAEDVEKCEKENPAYFDITEKFKAYLYDLNNKKRKRLQEAAVMRAEFYQKWVQGCSAAMEQWEKLTSHKFLMTPFTYEDRDQLRNKWVTQPGIEYECQIVGVCTEGVRVVERLGKITFIDFNTLARNWRFVDQTLCGKRAEFTAGVGPASNNGDYSSISIYRIK